MATTTTTLFYPSVPYEQQAQGRKLTAEELDELLGFTKEEIDKINQPQLKSYELQIQTILEAAKKILQESPFLQTSNRRICITPGSKEIEGLPLTEQNAIEVYEINQKTAPIFSGWSNEQDAALMHLHNKFRNNWSAIAVWLNLCYPHNSAHFPHNRTQHVRCCFQNKHCMERYEEYLSHGVVFPILNRVQIAKLLEISKRKECKHETTGKYNLLRITQLFNQEFEKTYGYTFSRRQMKNAIKVLNKHINKAKSTPY